MVGCTTVAGVFMFGVHAFMPVFGAASYGLFVALIYLINVSTIPSPGLQTIFAHEAASVRREDDGHLLAGNVVGVLLVMTAGWGLGLLAVFLGQEWVLARLKIENAKEHLLVASRDHGAGFLHHGTQFFAIQGIVAAAFGVHAKHRQQAIGNRVQRVDQGVKKHQQCAQ